MARAAGFVTLSLDGVYEGEDPRLIQLAPWDKHPNARAHRLLADRFYEELTRHADALNLNFSQTDVTNP